LFNEPWLSSSPRDFWSVRRQLYIVIGNYDIWTGENFFFFIIHGVIFVLWEAIFGNENKYEITTIRRTLKWIFLAAINLLY
jgi:hypothetical protein